MVQKMMTALGKLYYFLLFDFFFLLQAQDIQFVLSQSFCCCYRYIFFPILNYQFHNATLKYLQVSFSKD